MKYRQRNDVIDPDIPAQGSIFEYDRADDPDAPNDAYVIGEDGEAVQAPDSTSLVQTEDGPSPWAKGAAVVLFALFLGLTAWNFSRLLHGTPPPPKLTPFQVKQALYLGVMKIDAYRRVHQTVPESLTDAGLPDPGPYAYQRLDRGHYLISFERDGAKLEYDSSDPKETFFGSPKDVLKMGDSQ